MIGIVIPDVEAEFRRRNYYPDTGPVPIDEEEPDLAPPRRPEIPEEPIYEPFPTPDIPEPVYPDLPPVELPHVPIPDIPELEEGPSRLFLILLACSVLVIPDRWLVDI